MPERTTKIHQSRYTPKLPLIVGAKNGADPVLMETTATYRGLPAHTEVWVSGDGIDEVLDTFLIYAGEVDVPAEDEASAAEPAEPAEPGAPAPEPAPAPDGTQSYEVPNGTIDEVLAWVDGDPGRASAALEVEGTGQARVTLIAALEATLDANQEA